jgi:hypothetical protein
MAERAILMGGVQWRAFPSGFITQNVGDEIGVFFVSGTGPDRTIRVTRYSPVGTRSREQSFAELSNEQLVELFEMSQPSDTSPEAHYKP